MGGGSRRQYERRQPGLQMVVIERQTTYDCAPTLTDEQVLRFTKDGVLTFPAVVPEAINRRCVEFLDALAERNAALGASRGHFGPSDVDPVELLGEEWFVDGVLLCPEVAGAVRSLLGAAFGLPILLHNHRVTPANSPAAEQGWHHVRALSPPPLLPPPHNHPTPAQRYMYGGSGRTAAHSLLRVAISPTAVGWSSTICRSSTTPSPSAPIWALRSSA